MKQEIDDSIKSSLLKKSEHYRESLEEEAKELSDRTEKIVTNALIVGGSLALAYFVYRQFSGGSKKSKTKAKKAKAADTVTEVEEEVEETSGASKLISQIGTALVSQASVLLLSLAKEKLSEYLQAQAQKKSNEHS